MIINGESALLNRVLPPMLEYFKQHSSVDDRKKELKRLVKGLQRCRIIDKYIIKYDIGGNGGVLGNVYYYTHDGYVCHHTISMSITVEF